MMLNAVLPYLIGYKLVWYGAVCFMPHVAVSTTTGPKNDLITILIC